MQASLPRAALKYHCPKDWEFCGPCPGLALGLQESLTAAAVAQSPKAVGPGLKADSFSVAHLATSSAVAGLSPATPSVQHHP